MGKLIYNVEELGEVAEDMKKRINRAVVASAIKIRDNIRQAFINKASSLYRHHSGDISNLAEGIMIGKDYGGYIKIHAMGTKRIYDTYKTRFFIGGTRYRTQTKKLGRHIKPFSKGYISATDSLNEVVSRSSSTLTNYIRNAINGE